MLVLYLPTYHEVRPTSTTSSDAIGYGVTSSSALIAALRSSGCDMHLPDAGRHITRESMPASLSRSQSGQLVLPNFLDEVMAYRPDAIFIFHTFNTPAALIRKILLDANINLPIGGYLHGSHWDPTDLFRFIRSHGPQWFYLANTMALDGAFLQNPLEARRAAAPLREAAGRYTADHIAERLLPIFEEAIAK